MTTGRPAPFKQGEIIRMSSSLDLTSDGMYRVEKQRGRDHSYKSRLASGALPKTNGTSSGVTEKEI